MMRGRVVANHFEALDPVSREAMAAAAAVAAVADRLRIPVDGKTLVS
jgi:hypothetical protein